jgi:long-chain fatty acid transport protein
MGGARAEALAGLTMLVVATAPATTRASGFLLYEQSATALGKGSAMVASARDPSAAWFNPAALGFVAFAAAALNTAVLVPSTSFEPRLPGPGVANPREARLVPSLFAHVPLGDRVQTSLALLAPFGLAVVWPDGWVGAQDSLSTALTVIALNPSLAVRIDDRLSVAAGLSVMHGSVSLALALPTPPGGLATLSGEAWGVGFNLAVLFRLLPDQLHLGASYRSKARLPFHGNADFAPETTGFEALFTDQRASAVINFPDVIAFGVMARPHPQLELSAEVDWVRWTTLRELVVDFERPATFDRHIELASVNPLSGRFGIEWSWPDIALAVRTGASFDKSSSRAENVSASAPDGDRVGIGAGFGWSSGRVSFDAAYFYAYFLPTRAFGPNAHPEGTYRASAHVVALTVAVRGNSRP